MTSTHIKGNYKQRNQSKPMAVLKKKNQAVQKVVKKTTAPGAKAEKGSPFIFAVGRRKTAVARVRLFSGSGDNSVNGKSIKAYFAQDVMVGRVFEALDVTDKRGTCHFTVKVVGGGKQAQADAVAHGLARALVKADETHKKTLRDHGLLTRDPRMKETRKVGTGGKARRAKQSPKR